MSSDTASVEVEGSTALYTHPNLLDKTRDEMLFRLEIIRNRRLMAALSFKTTEAARIEKHNSKVSQQQANLIDKTRRDIYALDEKIEKIEKQIHKIMELQNTRKIMEM